MCVSVDFILNVNYTTFVTARSLAYYFHQRSKNEIKIWYIVLCIMRVLYHTYSPMWVDVIYYVRITYVYKITYKRPQPPVYSEKDTEIS